MGELYSSVVVSNFQEETSYFIYQETQHCTAIREKEAAGLAEPIGLNDWIDFHGADYYNMYRLAAGASLAFQFVGAPGDAYLMVTVGGMPYWTDAIGQIPFAINKFKNELESTKGNVALARQITIEAGQQYGDGSIFGGKSDFTNSYDNAMIRRAINWGENYFYYNSDKEGVFRRYYPPAELSKPSNQQMTKMY